MVWWDQIRTSRRRNRERPIETWDKLKGIMRRHFIPNYYHRDLHHKLQTLIQGNKSVEDYYKEIEMAMMPTDVHEDLEGTMSQILNGLRPKIAKAIEFQHYMEMNEIC